MSLEFQKTILFAYVSTRVKYVCKHIKLGASVAETDWLVWKYSDADLPNSEGPRLAIGGVADEASVNALAWSF